MRTLRDSQLFKSHKNPELAKIINTPNIELYAVNAAFDMLEDKAEYDYLNNLPTSFVLPPEAVDRLRAAAKKILFNSPEVKKVMTSYDSKIVGQ